VRRGGGARMVAAEDEGGDDGGEVSDGNGSMSSGVEDAIGVKLSRMAKLINKTVSPKQ